MAGICVRAGTFVYESYVPLFVVPFAAERKTLEDLARPLTVVRRRVVAAMPAAAR